MALKGLKAGESLSVAMGWEGGGRPYIDVLSSCRKIERYKLGNLLRGERKGQEEGPFMLAGNYAGGGGGNPEAGLSQK